MPDDVRPVVTREHLRIPVKPGHAHEFPMVVARPAARQRALLVSKNMLARYRCRRSPKVGSTWMASPCSGAQGLRGRGNNFGVMGERLLGLTGFPSVTTPWRWRLQIQWKLYKSYFRLAPNGTSRAAMVAGVRSLPRARGDLPRSARLMDAVQK
jgi:hypothetical protein